MDPALLKLLGAGFGIVYVVAMAAIAGALVASGLREESYAHATARAEAEAAD